MEIKRNIVQSTTEPQRDSLWLNEGILKTFVNGSWVPIGDDTGQIEKVAKEVSDLKDSKGKANGIAVLDSKGIIPTANLPESAAKADKLSTARNLWGQAFDGTKNVSGDIMVKNAIVTGYINASKDIFTTGEISAEGSVSTKDTLKVNDTVITDKPAVKCIDLGLPSGALWATDNFSEEGKVLYYQWADIKGYTVDKVGTDVKFWWDDYKYCAGSSKTMTKYCSVASYGKNGYTDNLTTIVKSDDVIRAKSALDIPTVEQVKELLYNTDIYLIKADGTEVHGSLYGDIAVWDTGVGETELLKGVEFRSKTDASVKLFVPADGGIGDNHTEVIGYAGGFWLANVSAATPFSAYALYFSKDGCTYTTLDRCYGVPMRGITTNVNVNLPSKGGTLVTEELLDKSREKGTVLAAPADNEGVASFRKLVPSDLPEQIVLDTLTYGVSWIPNVADPALNRVGNTTYHRTLPIQSGLKGCIVQMIDGVNVMYYLDASDWKWREESNAALNVLKDQTLTVADNVYTLVNDVFSTLRYEKQWVKINGIACQITSIDTATKTAALTPESAVAAGTYDVQLGAVLNGYDGEVMVEIPEFWIKSWDTETRREVRISPVYIDDTWEHQPHMFLAAYHDTVLNTVPANMGYLSTLPVNSALSVCNVKDYCRGGGNRTAYDQYLEDNPSRSDLGKSRTSINRATFRTDARNAGKENMSYLQYKRVMYWLFVIEYATFNSQAAYNSALTVEGYHQGGLGEGLSTMSEWNAFNGNYSVCPMGYANDLGNATGVKSLTYKAYNVPVNEITTMQNWGINAAYGSKADGKITVTNIPNANTVIANCGWGSTSVKTTYNITGLTAAGVTIQFKANNIVYGTLSADGEVTVTWPSSNTNRNIYFSTAKSGVEIVIAVTSAEAGEVTIPSQTLSVVRYRGIENPFGDIWNNVDGIIINSSALTIDDHKYNEVYVTEDTSLYNDSDYSKMTLAGLELNESGWIKEWNLGDTAEIIPRLNNGNSTQYKCDYHWINSSNGLRTLMLGGYAYNGAYDGLGSFDSGYGVGAANSHFGFRSSCIKA